MENPTTRVEICGAIGKLIFNRPEVLNAYNRSVSETLTAGLETLIGTDEVRVIVITGAGNAFMAGADINMLNDWNQKGDRAHIRSSLEATFNPTMLEDCPKPTIAAVNGLAFGIGCEVAMGCDYRIASQDAKFALPEIKLGIIPGGGGSQRLLRLVGATKALEMISTGDPIDAAEALRIGLVNQVVAPDKLWDAIDAFASRLTSKSALALKIAKQLVYQGGNRSLYQGIDYERDCFCEILLSEDAAEGTRAFIEKRKPVFKDR
ncbi:enoyl-CoA hydratase-isomerase [Desulfosarcina cetonica]|nr:enoyl-CoA hydratase-isomerase [Desulfosarcina cetonica]